MGKIKIKQRTLFPNCRLRISYAALKKDILFNNLLCHFNIENFKEAYDSLDGKKSTGIDGITIMSELKQIFEETGAGKSHAGICEGSTPY